MTAGRRGRDPGRGRQDGMGLRDLAELAAEILARSDADSDPDDGFEERAVKLLTTFQGAGVLTGDLSPECAAVVGTVLDALSAPVGAEDTRSQAQRYHDALHEAMRWLKMHRDVSHSGPRVPPEQRFLCPTTKDPLRPA